MCIRLIILFSIVALLVGCSQPRTYEYFMLHPQTIKSELERCSTATPGSATNDPSCVAAARADQDVRSLLAQATSNGQAFGANLISDQIQLAAAEQALQTAKATQTNVTQAQAQYKVLQFKVQSKLAALSLLGV